MLPTHLSPNGLALSWRSSKLSGRLVLRWLILGFTALVGLWITFPMVQEITSTSAVFSYESWIPDRFLSKDQLMWKARKEEVKEAFRHAWTGYKTRAFPNDELLAVSGESSNHFNGWSVTLFDSLDTMYVMGLTEEFGDAIMSIKNKHFVETKSDQYIPFFETTIRYLGGLLSAYALSKEPLLLDLADELGQVLLPSFEISSSGLPVFSVNLKTKQPDLGYFKETNTILFAEASSCQLEFKYLAKLTGKKEYYEKVQNSMNVLYAANVPSGLFGERWYTDTGRPSNSKMTVGAGSDSGYEYFLKQWIQTGDRQAQKQYIDSIDGILQNLVYLSSNRGLMYVTDMENDFASHRLEHLSCFLPGVLALGAETLDLPEDTRDLHSWAAHGLAYTCTMLYLDQESGLSPEYVQFTSDGLRWVDELRRWDEEGRVGVVPGTSEPSPERNYTLRDYDVGMPDSWLLRPEAIESIFIMWRTTRDTRWRERGYEIFQSIMQTTRTEYGFASVTGVSGDIRWKIDDTMPSYFLAETLKYLYLLFDNTRTINLNKWVFNTEAHPLPVFQWSTSEKKAFGVVP